MLSEVKTLLSNPWFYLPTTIGIVGVGIWGTLMMTQDVLPHPSAQVYVQKKSVDDSIVGLVFAGIGLGNKSFKATAGFEGGAGDPLGVIAWTKQLAEVDVVELLTNASDRSSVLLNYNQNVDQALKKASEIEDSLKADIANYTTEAAACESVKQGADQEYFQAIINNDPSTLRTSLKESVQQAQCTAEYRILINATTALATRVSRYRIVLAQKNEIISNNQELLLENINLVNSSVIDQLLILRRQLQQTTLAQ